MPIVSVQIRFLGPLKFCGYDIFLVDLGWWPSGYDKKAIENDHWFIVSFPIDSMVDLSSSLCKRLSGMIFIVMTLELQAKNRLMEYDMNIFLVRLLFFDDRNTRNLGATLEAHISLVFSRVKP